MGKPDVFSVPFAFDRIRTRVLSYTASSGQQSSSTSSPALLIGVIWLFHFVIQPWRACSCNTCW